MGRGQPGQGYPARLGQRFRWGVRSGRGVGSDEGWGPFRGSGWGVSQGQGSGWRVGLGGSGRGWSRNQVLLVGEVGGLGNIGWDGSERQVRGLVILVGG